MKQIIKYITFKSSADFETWQQENPKCSIHQVQPIMGGLNLNQVSETKHDVGLMPFSIFVCYLLAD